MALVCSSSSNRLSALRRGEQHLWVAPTALRAVLKAPNHTIGGKNKRILISSHLDVAARAAAEAGRSVAESTYTDVSVEEVMNPHPVLLQDSLSIKDAVHKMLDANVAGAPVVNDKGQLIGILSEADIIWKGAGRPEDHFIIPPVFIGFADAFIYLRDNKRFDEEVHKILAKTVGDAMVGREKVISVRPSMAMSEAAHLMLHHDVNLLPVVEEESLVVGVVTRHDILRGIYASKSPFL